jgi:hypothetical protein
MKDAEWCKMVEDEIKSLKEQVATLERIGSGCACRKNQPKIIEFDIEWPEADIGGLHFNAQKTHGVFDLKEDGNYYSMDILFLSARDVDTRRDLLSEYLDSIAVGKAFFNATGKDVRVFLPEGNQGIKKYNGGSCWYWLLPRNAGSSASFAYVSHLGNASRYSASGVGGCAPAFCFNDNA